MINILYMSNQINQDTEIKKNLVLSAFGKDSPGIVSDITDVIFKYDGNIEDSQMAILGGYFSMMLVFSVPENILLDDLSTSIETLRVKTGLSSINITEIEPTPQRPKASHILTIYGVDRPGIVKGSTSIIAEQNFNIIDFQTRLVESGEKPLYMLVIEMAYVGSEKPFDTSILEKELEEFTADNSLEYKLQQLENL